MKRLPCVGVLLVGLLGLATSASPAGNEGLPPFAQLVERNAPAVVNISTTSRLPDEAGSGGGAAPEDDAPFSEFFERFRDSDPPRTAPYDAESLGSGFLIDSNGLILTNHHVVSEAARIVVRLSDRREYLATVVGADRRSDLALLRIDAGDLPTVTIGRSAELAVGEWVLAIGSPFGFEHSATAGIVSAKGRNLPDENYVPFIQTDVAINPGNSGGPLFNLDGAVVGVNSHIYSRTGGFQGVSFAIPIELAMEVAGQLRRNGRVSRGWLGVVIQDVDRDLAASFELSQPRGALVSRVLTDGPADRAGLRAGDLILRYDDREVPTSGALPPMVGRTPVGETVQLLIQRDGERRRLEAVVAELPDEPRRQASDQRPEAPAGRVPVLDLRLEPVPPGARARLGISPNAGGVRITAVGEGAAAAAGLRQGDVITLLNREPVTGVAAFAARVAELPRDATLSLLVHREDGPRFVALRKPH